MKSFLVNLFIKDPDRIHDDAVRNQYGKLSSIVGIILNLALFAAKFTAGTLFNSISVTADAMNNLSDAGSSVISLVSFKLSSKPADKDHPFGHARIEYIASSIVAVIILLVGFELGKSSIGKMLKPDEIGFSILAAVILLISIGVKLWLYRFNIALGKHIGSTMIQATAADSLSDVLATSAVLISMLVSPLLHVQLDGYMGLIVSGLIVFSGYKVMKETMDRMLGKAPTAEAIKEIDDFIKKYDGVVNTHDLLVHDYGPNRIFASVHVEVDAKVDILKSHDLIDNIELEIRKARQVDLVVHLDPVVLDDPFVNKMRGLAAATLEEIDPELRFHDFRVVKGITHSNIIFDVTVPFSYKMNEDELVSAIGRAICKKDPSLRTVVNVDRG